MPKIFALNLFLFCFSSLFAQRDYYPKLYEGQELRFEENLRTIAFGSCNNQSKPQHIWESILSHEPDLWLWMGDIIYADTEDMEVMLEKYLKQKNTEGYKRLREKSQIIGIWDDHDYGVNDGDKGYLKKRESKELMLDFLDVPKEARVRNRPGAYQAYSFGEKGQKVKFILLDGRSFRDFLIPNPSRKSRYLPNTEGDMLGEKQWKWLEEQLTDSDADVHIIVSGVQVIPNEHPYEKWGNFPAARKKLFQLLAKTKPANVFLLSGDRHLAEISRINMDALPNPLYEITSSGMTHSAGSVKSNIHKESNRYRIGPLMVEKNFGLLKIDWSQEAPRVTAQIYSDENELLFSFDLVFVQQ
jgi:alkaline phosphatase D